MRALPILTLFFVLFSTSSLAKDWYVSSTTGKNKNKGTKAAPFKDIQKAAKKASNGDTIYVAAGEYGKGMRKKGHMGVFKRCFSLKGGYSTDFSKRDILKYKSFFQPPNKSNGTSGQKAMIEFRTTCKKPILIDGFIFDFGESNSYHPKKGKPSGFKKGMLLHGPAKAPGEMVTRKRELISFAVKSELTIKNNIFANAPWGVIKGRTNSSDVKILNNIFVANVLVGTEVWGGQARGKKYGTLEFANNTVLFTWTRTKDLGDMGYGVRAMTSMHYNIHNNLMGLNMFAAVDNTRDDPKKELSIDNNIFFANRQADLTLPGSGMFERVWVEDFDDLEIESSDGNEAPKDLKVLTQALDSKYLKAFMNATYTEETSVSRGGSNALRSMLGMNLQGKMKTKFSMFANKYPIDKVYELVGLIKGYGAQEFK